MEAETLKHIHWRMDSTDTVSSKLRKGLNPGEAETMKTLTIRQRYHFSSALARMSVVVTADHLKTSNSSPVYILTKVISFFIFVRYYDKYRMEKIRIYINRKIGCTRDY